jgi:DNA-binding GntR family transcriptional regulator
MVQDNHTAANRILDLKSLREKVYEYLRGEMQMGRIIPGSFIKLSAISERLGISKSPLRDAIIQLECEGFVTILPRRGVILNKLTLEEIKNVLEIVGALESAVIVAVFDQIKEGHINKMQRLNQRMREQLGSGGLDRFDQKYYQLNIAFHDVFLDLSRNKSLRRIIIPIKQRLYDFPRLSYIKEWELINCDEHDQFIQHIRDGEVEKAASLWRNKHWSFFAHEQFIRKFYSMGNKHIRYELERQA